MGLLSNLRGNATEIDIAKVQAELEPVLVPGESIGRGFKIFRDMFVFTDHRLIMIDKQGLTGSKVNYHSILYRNITQFSVETAGSLDADSELKIWVSGGQWARYFCMPTTSVPFFNSFVIGIPMCLAEANDDEGAPNNGRQRLNDFLTLFTLDSRAGLEPVLIKTGITEPAAET